MPNHTGWTTGLCQDYNRADGTIFLASSKWSPAGLIFETEQAEGLRIGEQ